MTETTGMAVPSKEIEKEAEKATGHDSIDKAGEKKVPSKKKDKASASKTTLADKKKDNTTKAATPKVTEKQKEKQEKDKTDKVKEEAFNNAMVINMQQVEEVSPEQQAVIENATREVVSDIIGHYKEDGLKDPKAVKRVLEKDKSYQDLMKALGYTPQLFSTI